MGQALSRLLNLTDGLLGQDLRFLILVTTNEDVSDLHPAITRPGRCRAAVPFETLSRAEAISWLDMRRAGDLASRLPEGRVNLSELYSVLANGAGGLPALDLGPRAIPPGFAPPSRTRGSN